MWKIGRSQVRVEDDRFLKGEGAYAADRPGAELQMVVVRSPVAAARLTEVDAGDAREMPGVVAVLTAREQAEDGLGAVVPRLSHPGPDGGDMAVPDVRPLATDLLQYVGHPVAVVLAETRAAAEDAAEAVLLEYEDRAAVVDPLAALAEDAPRVWPDLPDNRCFHVEKGDGAAVARAFAEAAHVTRARMRINRVTAVALEPRALVAEHDATTGYRLEVGSQTPHRVASDLAPILGVTPGDIRVVARDTGGSFGMKNAGYVEYALALWAARRTGRSVAWQATRTESFMSDAHARDQWADVALALDADFRILALDVHVTAGLGACMGPATTHPPVANLAGLAGVYGTPAIRAVVDGVFTNCQHVAPYRGAGRPEATYMIERILDIAAAETGQGRVALRRRNLIPADDLPHATPLGWVYDSGDFEGVLDEALAAADWDGFAARRAEAEVAGQLRGIGLSLPIEIAGGPVKAPHKEYAELSVGAQGSARLVVGTCSSGQGHETAFRQVVCDRLGIEAAAIEVVAGDTGAVAKGTGTFGSRSLTAAGTALWQAMDDAIARTRPVAAEMLGVGEAALVFEGAAFHAPDGRSASFLEAMAHGKVRVETQAHVGADGATFPNGCHVCEVAVDPETGRVRVERYTVVDDVGTVVNPLLVKGQIAGGVAQGIGQAVMEDVSFDAETGQLLSASFMDYALPRFDDIPGIAVLSHPVPTAANPLGAKGAGEAGTVGALAACINAVVDALSGRGIAHMDMPATPARVWARLREAEQ
ncbi:putative carbon monoxide dehydrogenase large subunit transmembrane protein [Oceanicola granulosus HTCC2516]|uniref:Putative carbon monoxide dehydrogenase large subunit transmembrane protein n=1 Tax=Oceanicola granulosus (strain ATCC BAA-861 / DSM 15982 / KCTC 12143 / HTCC2516) TaxID=314256 RepID=Q2CGN6_OCEGH|nr:xanthine dehydrogenase family protein molybdopterin-binding subunit [Oceanicola granulosus]EAR51899.1 putative carbon monoxide dehydrogenase large subunit transmembrane protein [Oceanicola granulosus HTCC2516]